MAPDGDHLLVDAMFRDTHRSAEGDETLVHEYTLEARVHAATLLVEAIEATPRALPWRECPEAAASPGRLVGRSVRDLRAVVRAEFHGISTCTHLNDLLRSLGDLATLVVALP